MDMLLADERQFVVDQGCGHMDLKCELHLSVYNKFFSAAVSIVIVVRVKYIITTVVFVKTIKLYGSLLFLLFFCSNR